MSPAEVRAMPTAEVERQLLIKLDELTRDIGGPGGIRERLAKMETILDQSRAWEISHEQKDDGRHAEIAAALATVAKAQAADEGRDQAERERSSTLAALVDPRYLVPLIAAAIAAAGGYAGGAYAPPSALVPPSEVRSPVPGPVGPLLP